VKQVGILDVGYGNIESITQSLKANKVKSERVVKSDDVKQFEFIIIPGVGSFGQAIENIVSKEVDKALIYRHENNLPTLGICLGLHLLSRSSTESKSNRGLGVFDYEFQRLQKPQIGWKEVPFSSLELFQKRPSFYFNHAYGINIENEHDTNQFCSRDKLLAIAIKGKTVGCQFHPEKSQRAGKAFFYWFLEEFSQ